MNKLFKNIIVFMGTIFAILMGLFGLASLYAAAIGTNNYWANQTYFLTLGLICLAIASTAIFLSVKLHYHR